MFVEDALLITQAMCAQTADMNMCDTCVLSLLV